MLFPADVEARVSDAFDAADRPLVVTRDPELLDAVLNLAAVADVDVHVVPDLSRAGPRWASAPCVLVGGDVAGQPPVASLPSRPRLAVVTLSPGGATALDAPVLVLPADQDEVLGLIERPAASWARLVAVAGGRGGAGASTLAVALAVTGASTGRRVMLVDADPYGGGLDLALGAEDRPGLRWPDLDALHGPVASAVLVDTLPRAHGTTLLSHARPGGEVVSTAAMHAVLDAAQRAHDLVVVDVSRHLGAESEPALRRADLVLLVVPAEVRATAAAGQVAAAAGRSNADVRVVVRGPAPSGLDARAVSRLLGLPCAGWLRPEPGLAALLERGQPPARSGRGPLADLCRALLRDLDVPTRRVA